MTYIPIEVLKSVRSFKSTLEPETFMNVPDPLLFMVYEQFSTLNAMNGSVVLESLDQALLTICKKTCNVSMLQGNIQMESVASDYGRFYQDETAARTLGSNNTWCWAPNTTKHLVSVEEHARPTVGNIAFLSDSPTMSFCTYSKWLVPQAIAGLLIGQTSIRHSTRRNITDSAQSLETSDITNRLRKRSLSRIMESMAAQMNQIYITKSNESATGMGYTYETVVAVRWAWLALPIAVQALGLAFLLAVIATSNKAPLWKGSFLASLYHGFAHVPMGDDTATSSGMAEAAGSTRAVLTKSSKTKTILLEY